MDLRFLLLMLILLAATPASANVVTVLADADNTIFSEDPTLSNGAGDHLFVGETDNGFLRRGLIRFDVASAVPAGSTINSVTMTLNMSRSKANDKVVSLHRVTTGWGEGTSHAAGEEGEGASATSGDATWSHAIWSGTTWTTPGGDYIAAASSSTVIGRNSGPFSWSGAGLVVDVQGWLNAPSTNAGWVLIGAEGAVKTAKRFDTRNNSTPAVRPILQIDFSPPANSGACCAPDGSCSETTDSASCAGVFQGQATECLTAQCPQPTGACCLPDAQASCVEVEQTACTGVWRGALTQCAAAACPVVLTPFVDPLPIPAVATPTAGTAGAAASYRMAMVEFEQQLHRDLPVTRVWGFDDGTGPSFPGPTIEASTGVPITVTWANDLRGDDGTLRQSHMLPVDTCAHGAVDDAPRTVVHLHGGHVPAAVDGYPEAAFLPGQEVVYDYPNAQEPGTLWYHDHALGITRLNVYMGLAGYYIVRDTTEAALGLPAGEFEIPLAIQDRSLAADGALVYPPTWQEHFFGDFILVNGKVWPYLNVKQGKYRFRILNGSNARAYTLSLSNGATLHVIGTDGGLLDAPVAVSSLTVTSGERYDVVIDFAGLAAGTEITLTNSAPAPYPGSPGDGVVPDVVKFVVTADAGHTAALPASLRPVVPIPESESVITRDFELAKFSDPCAGSKWLINGLGWSDITEFPQLGTTETWRFINRSGNSHPMHMHLVFFQVLDRQSFTESAGVITPVGTPVVPVPAERGWKDTVEVGPDEIVRVIARFEDYTGRYPYHCHILEHEDHEMMRQFETFTVCGDGHRGMPDEECDDGNLIDGDGCESTCVLTPMGGDVGVTDMGVSDMGVSDMGVSDMGVSDVGVFDMGASDMGIPDVGAETGGADVPDFGTEPGIDVGTDAGGLPGVDTGIADAGDGGLPPTHQAKEGCCRVTETGSASPFPLLLLLLAFLGIRRRANR